MTASSSIRLLVVRAKPPDSSFSSVPQRNDIPRPPGNGGDEAAGTASLDLGLFHRGRIGEARVEAVEQIQLAGEERGITLAGIGTFQHGALDAPCGPQGELKAEVLAVAVDAQIQVDLFPNGVGVADPQAAVTDSQADTMA